MCVRGFLLNLGMTSAGFKSFLNDQKKKNQTMFQNVALTVLGDELIILLNISLLFAQMNLTYSCFFGTPIKIVPLNMCT